MFVTYIHSFNFLPNLPANNQIWLDKTEVMQSSLSRLNSGENISELVNVICFS